MGGLWAGEDCGESRERRGDVNRAGMGMQHGDTLLLQLSICAYDDASSLSMAMTQVVGSWRGQDLFVPCLKGNGGCIVFARSISF